jgi:C-terminal processing protease CtpA/Prc
LVDENTASASEIFAAAMQDNDRAVIVGARTFGKGLVQDIIPLADGSGLHAYKRTLLCTVGQIDTAGLLRRPSL